jgi:hypothetical protein
MTVPIPRLFANVTAKLEDLHSVSVEGQRHDNSRDMQRALACQLRMGIVSLDSSLQAIKRGLGDDRD